MDHTAVRFLEHGRISGYVELLLEWSCEIFLEHILPEDRDTVDSKFREAMENRNDWDFECRILRAAVGRELRMIEMKKEINEFFIQTEQTPRYSQDSDEEHQ